MGRVIIVPLRAHRSSMRSSRSRSFATSSGDAEAIDENS
jgi:hypothetical protein